MNNLQTRYKKEILPQLKEKLGLKNDMVAPKLIKVSINVGFGRHNKDKAYIERVEKVLTAISGQKIILTKAKKSIAAFKVREGMTVGAMVTLRKQYMYDFVEKLVSITFPRVRDFRGISEKSVDAAGNLTVGFKEHTAFPEIGGEDSENVFGLEISLVTNTKVREKGLELFRLIGFPFKK